MTIKLLDKDTALPPLAELEGRVRGGLLEREAPLLAGGKDTKPPPTLFVAVGLMQKNGGLNAKPVAVPMAS